MAFFARDIMAPAVSLLRRDRGKTLVKKLSGKYHALPVVDNQHLLVGIVTEEDVLQALRRERAIFECTAESLMSCGHIGHENCQQPVAVDPDTPLPEVVRTIFREHLSTVPVVKNGRLLGIIDRKDVV